MYEEQMTNAQTSLPSYAINLKQSFILDLNNMKSRSQQPMDLGIIKLGSPDLEKFLVQPDGSVVTALTPTTQILFPKSVTEEQEAYARGFIDALDELHKRQGNPVVNNCHNNPEFITSNNFDDDVETKNIFLLNNSEEQNEFTTLTTTTTYPQYIINDHINNNSEEFLNNYHLVTMLNSRFNSSDLESLSPGQISSLPPAQTLLSRITSIQKQQENHFQKQLCQQEHEYQQNSLDLSITSAQILPTDFCTNFNNIKNNDNIDIKNDNNKFNSNRDDAPNSIIIAPIKELATTTTITTTACSNLLSLDNKDLNNNNNSIISKSMSNNNYVNNLVNIYANINNGCNIGQLDEPSQTVPCLISSPQQSTSSAASVSEDSPSPASLSNCDDFDRLEMKRARNRLAAQKCRSRKLERIAVLSQKVEELKDQNAKLEKLKAEAAKQVEELKEALMQHICCQELLSGREEGELGLIPIDMMKS